MAISDNIAPNLGEGATSGETDSIILASNKGLQEAKRQQRKWRENAREDYDFVAGNQWGQDDIDKLTAEMRPVITFNRVGPIVDAVSGQEINNRQEVKYFPRTIGKAQVNEILTAAAEWVRDECDAGDEESEAFLDAVIGGIGWTETRLDYEQDLDGMIIIDRIDPFEMYYEASSSKKNLKDNKKLWRVKIMSRNDAVSIWGRQDYETATMRDAGEGAEPIDRVEAAYYHGDQANTKGDDAELAGMVKITEYQYCVKESIYRIPDMTQGKLIEVEPKEYKRMEPLLKMAGIKSVPQKKLCWYRAFYSGAVLLENKKSPCPTESTYKPITAKRDRTNKCFYGIVRAMKDPQRWANKFFSQSLDILNSNAKGAPMVETDAVDNVREFEDNYASTKGILWVNPGALSQGKIQPRNPPAFPQQINQMMEFAVSSIPSAAGVNEAIMGLTTPDATGVLEGMRKQAGINILAYLFDGLKRYRKEQGCLLMYFIQTYISDGRLIRVVGQEGAQYVPLIRDHTLGEYDTVVDEAPTAPNVKERTWTIITNLMPQLSQMGLQMPPQMMAKMIQYSPLPTSLSSDISQMIMQKAQQPPPPPPPMEMAKVQQLQSSAKQAESTAMLNIAKAQGMGNDSYLDQLKAHTDAILGVVQAQSAHSKQQMDGVVAAMKAHADAAKVQAENFKTIADIHKTNVQHAGNIMKTRATLTTKSKTP